LDPSISGTGRRREGGLAHDEPEMVALVDNDLPVAGHEIRDGLPAHQALDHRDVDPAGGVALPAPICPISFGLTPTIWSTRLPAHECCAISCGARVIGFADYAGLAPHRAAPHPRPSVHHCYMFMKNEQL